jgi:hypothetical protein
MAIYNRGEIYGHSKFSLRRNGLASARHFHAVPSRRSWRACLSKVSARPIFDNRSLQTNGDRGTASGPELAGSDLGCGQREKCTFEPGKLLKTLNNEPGETRRIGPIYCVFEPKTDRITHKNRCRTQDFNGTGWVCGHGHL